MFGFSFSKLLLLTLVILGVWALVRIGNARRDASRPIKPVKPPPAAAESLERCPICAVYAASGRLGCERADCPYLRVER